MNQKKYFLGGVFALVLLSGVIVFASPVLRGSSQFAALEGEDVREPGSEGGFNGPGGCTTTEECIEYCSYNSRECIDYCETYPDACTEIGMPPIRLGPGGCGSAEECMQYCTGSDNAQECQEFCEANPDACEDVQSPTDGDYFDDDNDDYHRAPDGQDPFQDFDPDDFGDRYFGPDGGDHGMRGPGPDGPDSGQNFYDAKEIAREALNLILDNMEKLSPEDQNLMDAITSKLIRITSDQFTEAAELLDEAAAVFEHANIPVVGGGGPGGPPVTDMMDAIRAGIDLLGRYADPSGVEETIDEIMEACSSGDLERCEDAASGMEDLMMDLTRDAHRNAEAEDGWEAAIALCIDFMTVMKPVIDDPMVFANGVEFACEMFGKMGWDPHAMDDGGGQGGDYGGYDGGDYSGDYGGDYGGFGGPGGCRNEEECQAFCQENPDECGGPGKQGPHCCISPDPEAVELEQCQAYCNEHPEQCRKAEKAWCRDNPEYCPGGNFVPQCDSGGSGGDFSGDYGGNYGNYGDDAGDGSPPDTQSCVSPPGLIVSWWNADNVSGTTVPDGSKVHRNNGTIVGGVTSGAVDIGYVFEFDGSSGHINMGNPESLNFGTGPFSLEAWLYWDGGGSSINNIMRKSSYPVSGPGAGYWLRIGGGNLEFHVGETTGIEGQPRGLVTTPVRSNTWYHVVAVRDSSGTMKLYVDGELKGTAQAPNANTTSNAPFTLGAWDDRFGVSELLSGLLDQVSVYTNALDASDVQELFNMGSTRKCTSQ